MVTAVQASNAAWGRARRRIRLWRTGVLAVAVIVLAALIPFLVKSTNQPTTTRVTGLITAKNQIIPLPSVNQGHVSVIGVLLNGNFGAETAISLESRALGEQQYKVQQSKLITTNRESAPNITVNFAANIARSTAYVVAIDSLSWKSEKQTPARYSVTVQSAPLILDLRKPGTEATAIVNSPVAVVKLYPNQPVFLGFGGNVNMADVEGVQTLFTDSQQADFSQQAGYVVESPSGGYAAVSSYGDYSGYVDVSQPEGLYNIKEKVLTPGPNLSIGTQVHIKQHFASIESVSVKAGNIPFGVETSCKNGYESISALLGSDNSPVTSAVKSIPEGSILVPNGYGSQYQLILITDPSGDENEVDCQVAIRSFARQAITAARDGRIEIDAGSPFNAYSIRMPTDSVIIVPSLNGAHASLSCPSGQVTESGALRLLAFVPANRDCILSIAHAPGQTGKSTSFALLIDQVSGGRG